MFSGDLLDIENSFESRMAPGVSLMSAEMDEQVNPLERDHSLSVVLPGGLEKMATVHGSQPVMDFLVTLCACYHLNPSDYTVEFLSPNKNNINFKPNSPIGLLEAEKMVLKPKVIEENIRRSYMPEATVRLLINYNKSHKTVVRVNPRLPLEMLLPLVCDKCEFNIETTVLLRDAQSSEPLDMTKTLNDHGLREVFAKDLADPRAKTSGPAAVTPTEVISPSPLQELPKERKQTQRGFFSLFRRRKKKHEALLAASAPSSPGLSKHVGGVLHSERISAANTLPADIHKKRRAPPPPMGAALSVPNNLSTCHVKGAQRSGESTLRSTKRRAPPPPCTNNPQDLSEDADVQDSLKTLEELRESDESGSVNLSMSSSSSPHPSLSRPSLSSSRPSPAHLHEPLDLRLPSFRRKDFSDARSALAKVLTSSVSKGALAKRLRSSAAFPKFHVSSCVSMAPECSDYELESIFRSSVSTGNEWEDPSERRGVTTFKVVPPQKPSCDVDLSVDVPEQYQISAEENHESETSPDVGNNQTEIKEDPCSPDGSEGETRLHSPDSFQQDDGSASPPPLFNSDSQNGPESPLCGAGDAIRTQNADEESSEEIAAAESHCSDEDPNPESHCNPEDPSEFLQSPTADLDPCGSDGKEDEAKPELEEGSFPPPPPPVFFKEDLDVERDGEDSAASSNGHATAFSEAQKPESTSALPEQSSDGTGVAPSRFALAVAVAVQRSRHSLCKGLRPQASGTPHQTLPSPPRSTYQYGA